MIVYLLIIGFILLVSYKLKNNIFALICGFILMSLYNASQINNFFGSVVTSLDFTTFFYNHRLLTIVNLLLIILIIQIYKTIGLNDKINLYLTNKMNVSNNYISLFLSIFTNYIDSNNDDSINPYYRYGKGITNIFFPASISFLVIYFLVSQYLSVSLTYQVILLNLFSLSFLLFLIGSIGLKLNIFKQKEIQHTLIAKQYIFNNIKKMTFMNIILLIIGFIIGFIFHKIILIGFFYGLVLVFLFSLFYTDLYLHKNDLHNEKKLFQNLLKGVNHFIFILIYLLIIVVYCNTCINVFSTNWQISYHEIIPYFSILLLMSLLIILINKSSLMAMILVIPLFLPIINLVTNPLKILFLTVFISFVLLIKYNQLLFKNNNKAQIYYLVANSVIVLASCLIALISNNLICSYGFLILGVIIILIIYKLKGASWNN